MRWELASRILGLVLDATALLAVFASGDLSPLIFLPSILSYSARALARSWKGLSDGVLLGLIVVLVLVAGWVALKRFYPFLVVAAYGSVALQALIILGADTDRMRFVRVGIGIVSLSIGAALTPEVWVGVIIFFYMALASVHAMTTYLMALFAKEREIGRVPRGFFGFSFAISCVVLALSILMFPLLPRVRETPLWSLGGELGSQQTGFSEQVDLSQIAPGSMRDTSPAVRIFSPSGQVPEMPYGLIRAKSLDVFDGKGWRGFSFREHLELASQKRPRVRSAESPSPPGRRSEWIVAREPLNSALIPVPYGAVWVVNSESEPTTAYSFSRGPEGSWSAAGSERSSVTVHVSLEDLRSPNDRPRKEHLSLPDWNFESPDWKDLRRRLFKVKRTPAETARALEVWFQGGAFRGEFFLGDADQSPQARARTVSPERNISAFLFRFKTGHCELFASSAALLLRLQGIPSRVVSGFRVSRGPQSGVLTLRQSDAHAWVEAWSEADARWIPIDPTPQTISGGAIGWQEWWTQTKEGVSILWAKYVVGFGRNSVVSEKGAGTAPALSQAGFKGLLSRAKSYGAWALGLGVAALLGFGLLRFLLYRIRSPWLADLFFPRRIWNPAVIAARWKGWVGLGPPAGRLDQLRFGRVNSDEN